MSQQETPWSCTATVVSPPCTAAGWFHRVCLCSTAELKRRKKPSVTPGWGPARCGDAARHGHMASTFPRPPQKGLPRFGLAAERRDGEGQKRRTKEMGGKGERRKRQKENKGSERQTQSGARRQALTYKQQGEKRETERKAQCEKGANTAWKKKKKKQVNKHWNVHNLYLPVIFHPAAHLRLELNFFKPIKVLTNRGGSTAWLWQ